MRKAIRLVHVHRTAENDQAVVAAHVRLQPGLAREVDVADAEAMATQQRIEQSQRLSRGVLEDEQLAHGRAWCVRVAPMAKTLLTALLLMLANVAMGKAPAVPADLAARVRAYDDAQVKGDKAALEDLLAADYVLV